MLKDASSSGVQDEFFFFFLCSGCKQTWAEGRLWTDERIKVWTSRKVEDKM